MDSFTTWMLRGLSAKQRPSRLSKISDLIDWVPIRRRLERPARMKAGILEHQYFSETAKMAVGGAAESATSYRSRATSRGFRQESAH